MVLVDTSVWIDHFRRGNNQLVKLLNRGDVFCHEMIIGEIACGTFKNRSEILSRLKLLPHSMHVRHEEILLFIEQNQIIGHGLGYIDVTLLVSSILTSIPIWSLDKKMSQFSKSLRINYSD